MIAMDEIYNKLVEIIGENIENVHLELDQIDNDLSQLGMDSLAFIAIIVSIEENFEIEYPDEYLLASESNTIKKMAKIIYDELMKKV